MKRFLTIMALALLTMFPAMAQEGLQIDSVFNFKALKGLTSRSDVKSSTVKGDKLDPYNLDYFRSIKFSADGDMIARIVSWLESDAQGAISMESESNDGQLVYMLLTLPGRKSKENQYVGFQLKPVMTTSTYMKDGVEVTEKKAKDMKEEAYVTVVYMRGKATMGDLRNMFKRR